MTARRKRRAASISGSEFFPPGRKCKPNHVHRETGGDAVIGISPWVMKGKGEESAEASASGSTLFPPGRKCKPNDSPRGTGGEDAARMPYGAVMSRA